MHLSLAPGKIKFIAEKPLGHVTRPCLTLAGCEIEKVDNLQIRGSLVFARGNERGTYEHRIGAGWACYNKWKHILESRASIEARMKLFQKSVSRNLLWGRSSTRQDVHNQARLISAQKFMVRKNAQNK